MRRAAVLCIAIAVATVPPRFLLAASDFPVGELVERVACLSDPTQTYTLYLPSGYDPSRRWPMLLIFDPRGRSVLAAELFRDAAEEFGWIMVSSNDTRSDGPMEPNIRAVNALWPEVNTRFPIDPNRIYAAGFSGGAHLAYGLGKGTGALAGVVACGGRLLKDGLEGTEFSLFGAAGTTDFNYSQMHRVDDFLEEQGNHHRLEIFDGPHRWMPPELARHAVEWLEIDAMRRGARPRDDDLITRLYDNDMRTATELEKTGNALAAMRRYRSIVTTFEGLRVVDEPARRAERLEGSPEVARARKEEAKCDRFEARYLDQFDEVVYDLRVAQDQPVASGLERDFRIAELQRRADGSGCDAVTAQRLLNTVFTFTSFYLPREFFEAKRNERAVVVLEVAVGIQQDNPIAWYNLACARALARNKVGAVDALARSVDRGFRNLDQIESDADLESIRSLDGYREIVRELRGEDPPE
jgi:predicted esterase